MNPALYICCFLPIIMLFYLALCERKKRHKKQIIIRKIRKRRSSTEVIKKEMTEMIKNFIGKKCLIDVDGTESVAVIESFEDNWLLVRLDTGLSSMINVDYVSAISEVKEKNKK